MDNIESVNRGFFSSDIVRDVPNLCCMTITKFNAGVDIIFHFSLLLLRV